MPSFLSHCFFFSNAPVLIINNVDYYAGIMNRVVCDYVRKFFLGCGTRRTWAVSVHSAIVTSGTTFKIGLGLISIIQALDYSLFLVIPGRHRQSRSNVSFHFVAAFYLVTCACWAREWLKNYRSALMPDPVAKVCLFCFLFFCRIFLNLIQNA